MIDAPITPEALAELADDAKGQTLWALTQWQKRMTPEDLVEAVFTAPALKRILRDHAAIRPLIDEVTVLRARVAEVERERDERDAKMQQGKAVSDEREVVAKKGKSICRFGGDDELCDCYHGNVHSECRYASGETGTRRRRSRMHLRGEAAMSPRLSPERRTELRYHLMLPAGPTYSELHNELTAALKDIEDLTAQLALLAERDETAAAATTLLSSWERGTRSWQAGLCCCHACQKERDEVVQMMILCPTCGNKRCPKASDHKLECTGSNEPGQEGSVYG